MQLSEYKKAVFLISCNYHSTRCLSGEHTPNKKNLKQNLTLKGEKAFNKILLPPTRSKESLTPDTKVTEKIYTIDAQLKASPPEIILH